MFSLFASLFRWTLTLALAAVLTVALLLLQVRYEGNGRFRVVLKERMTFEGTLVWTYAGEAPAKPKVAAGRTEPVTQAGTSGIQTQAKAGPSAASAQGAAECRAQRERLDAALARYRARPGKRSRELDIFAMLEAGVLDEIPSCPLGGAFELPDPAKPQVACTSHR